MRLRGTAAEAGLSKSPPIDTFQRGEDRIEVWDAGDFDPWETLDWRTVRLMRYRQRKKDGSVVQWAGRREHQLTAPCGGYRRIDL